MSMFGFGKKGKNRPPPGGGTTWDFGDDGSKPVTPAATPKPSAPPSVISECVPPSTPPALGVVPTSPRSPPGSVAPASVVDVDAINRAKKMLTQALDASADMDQIVYALKTYLPIEALHISEEGLEKFRKYEAPFATQSTSAPPPEVTADDLLTKLRDSAKERGAYGIAGIGRWFRIIAGDDALVDLDEFQKALTRMGCDASKSEGLKLFQHFDSDGSGKINYEEFLLALRGEMSEERKVFVDMAFKSMDKDGSGVLTVEDVMKRYDASQHPAVVAGTRTAHSVYKEFLDTFDGGEKDGQVTPEEFLSYYTGVSASIDDDAYWELMMRNAWHISGGSGQTENTTNRRVLVTHQDGSQSVEEITDDMDIAADDIDAMRANLAKRGIDAKDISVKATGLEETPEETPAEAPAPPAEDPPPADDPVPAPEVVVPADAEPAAAGALNPTPSEEPLIPRFSRSRGRGAGPSSIVFG